LSLSLICNQCGKQRNIETFSYRCNSCNYPLEVNYDIQKIRDDFSIKKLKDRQFNIWRYNELLPLKNTNSIISLHEGGTPLLQTKNLAQELGLDELFLKDETRNPTWSFKDRGSSIGVSFAVELGAKAVGCVSSGNMAASMATYAARAGMKCYIVAPLKTPMGKIAQMLVSGANLALVEAPYHLISDTFIKNSYSTKIFSVHNDSPMRIEGQKTVSFEISDQMNWEVPDWIIIPTSSAGNFSAVWKGFTELKTLDIVESIPKMALVQASGNAPIVNSFHKKINYVEPNPNPKTIASGITNPNPPSGKRALKILKKSKGYAESASDKEILEAQGKLAKSEGLYVEPAAAVPLACLKKMLLKGIIESDEKVVLTLTGSGLKDIDATLTYVGRPKKLSSLNDMLSFMKNQ
jgi:threonine synthase